MVLYRYALLLVSSVIIVNATTLKEVIQSTIKNNISIKALRLENQSQQKAFKSVENIYNPTVTIGANISRLDLDKRDTQVGTTAAGFLKVGVTLYDGGKNGAFKNQKNYEYKTALLNTVTTTKETILEVVTLFFQTKTMSDNIKVFLDKGRTLKAQYERMKIRYDTKMATIDEVLKLRSEYETNQYTIEELKYQKKSLLQNLSLLANKDIGTLDYTTLPDIDNLTWKDSENIEALKMSVKAKSENIKVISSINRPQIKLENSLNIYGYDDYNDRILRDLPSNQNQIILSLSYNFFDTTSKDKIQSAKLEKLASIKKLEFIKKQEKMTFTLAKDRLKTQQLKLNSLKSAVQMGDSVYDMISIKYKNGIVDNIAYLDALSKKVYNQALYKQALNDYEIAKANYYFSSGIDYKKVLREWK